MRRHRTRRIWNSHVHLVNGDAQTTSPDSTLRRYSSTASFHSRSSSEVSRCLFFSVTILPVRLKAKIIAWLDTDLRHGLNHHPFVFLVAQRRGVIGIGVKENGIIVVWVATKLPAKGLKLALDGLPCFRRQGMRRDRWAMTFLQPQPDS